MNDNDKLEIKRIIENGNSIRIKHHDEMLARLETKLKLYKAEVDLYRKENTKLHKTIMEQNTFFKNKIKKIMDDRQ